MSEIENSLEVQRFQSKFNDSDEDEYDESNYSKTDGFYTDGQKTQEWFEKYKYNQLVNENIITEEQFYQVMDSAEIRTYMKLRNDFKKLKIKNVKKLMDSLYKEIQSILKQEKTESEKARLVQEILSKSLICRQIPKKKEELLMDAASLGLSVNEKSSKESICYALLGAIVVTEKNSAFLKQMEKMFFNPDKKGLPDKLSDMTSGQISQRLTRDIKRLSGPIFGALLVPKPDFKKILGREPPVFMLLGDVHIGNQECQSCLRDGGCYSLYKRDPTFLKYLSNLAKGTNLSIDLFIEQWLAKKDMILNSFIKKREIKQNSALNDITDLTIYCIGQRKEIDLRRSCFFTEFRTHNANIRHGDNISDNKYIADTIMRSFLIGTPKYISKIYEKIFPDFTFEQIMEELIALYSAKDNVETITIYFHSPFFKKYSRTLHEFYKLPHFLQTKLKERLLILAESDTENTYMMHRRSKDREIMKLVLRFFLDDKNENEKFDETKDIISNIIDVYDLSLGSILLDIYTISRVLKGFDGGLPSQLSVVYLGYAHIKHQIELLNDYYDVVKTWGTVPRITTEAVMLSLPKCIDQN